MEVRRFLRAAVYGCYGFSQQRFARVRLECMDALRAYFADRPRDFLQMDIAAGEEWEKLAAFLDVPSPTDVFPYAPERSPAPPVER
jgi:hypothetical protein